VAAALRTSFIGGAGLIFVLAVAAAAHTVD